VSLCEVSQSYPPTQIKEHSRSQSHSNRSASSLDLGSDLPNSSTPTLLTNQKGIVQAEKHHQSLLVLIDFLKLNPQQSQRRILRLSQCLTTTFRPQIRMKLMLITCQLNLTLLLSLTSHPFNLLFKRNSRNSIRFFS
jgi:hypothetical protein